MSMINDVLRDLEERKAPEREGMTSNRSLVHKTSTPNRWPLVVILIVLVIGAVGIYLAFSEPENLAEPIVEKLEQDPISDQGIQPLNTVLTAREQVISDTGSIKNVSGPESKSTVSPEVTTQAQVSVNPKAERIVSETIKPVVKERSTLESAAAPAKTKATDAVGSQGNKIATREASLKPVVTESKKTKASATKTEKRSELLAATLSPQAMDLQNVDAARQLEKSGQRAEAIRTLRTFIENYEQDDYSRVALSKLLISENRVAELNDLMVQVDQNSIAELREVKARWYAASGQYLPAVQLLQASLPSVSEYTEYHALLASYQQKLGAFEESIASYSSLLEVDPERAEWWLGMAIGFDRLKRYQDASLAYDAALKLPNLEPTLIAFASKRLQQLNP